MFGKGKLDKRVDLRKLDSRSTKIIYWVFQVLILLTLLTSIVLMIVIKDERETHLSHILLSGFALIFYNIPSFLKKRFNVYIPTVLQVFTLIFIYAHFIIGEVQGTYLTSAIFDKILHTTSGLAIATIGFSLVNILNQSKNTHLTLSPFFVAFFAFCFALAVAVVWEIIEFSADSLLGMNMQRYIPPAGLEQEVAPKQGYGLIDSMWDIIVSTLAALGICLLGFFSLKTKKNFMNKFLIRVVSDYDFGIEEARLAGDDKLVSALIKAKEESEKVNAEEDAEAIVSEEASLEADGETSKQASGEMEVSEEETKENKE